MKEIKKSEFITDVTVTKMSKKELAAKYELPETEIKKIMKGFDLKVSRKKHETYVIVDDVVETAISSTVVGEVAVNMTPLEPVFQEETI